MQVVTTIGLDIAKSVFQVHGVDVHGAVVVRRQLRRRERETWHGAKCKGTVRASQLLEERQNLAFSPASPARRI